MLRGNVWNAAAGCWEERIRDIVVARKRHEKIVAKKVHQPGDSPIGSTWVEGSCV